MSWYDYLFGRTLTPQPSRVCLGLELLEDRVVPAVFTVNVVDDTPDANLNDAAAKDAAGNTSLRAAIMQANHTAGLDTIKFNIANALMKIRLKTVALPSITDQVVIDASAPDNKPLQVICLSRVTVGEDKLDTPDIAGLHFLAGAAGSEVIRLNIFGFDQSSTGIKLDNVASVTIRFSTCYNNHTGVQIRGGNASDNRILGCSIGQVSDGSEPGFAAQYFGVHIFSGAHDNYVGLQGEGNTNTISGNSAFGVYISDANNNFVHNNTIGLAFGGLAFNPASQSFGVIVDGSASGNVIGGATILANDQISDPANVISGNKSGGVGIHGAGSNKVQGNFIGTDKSGTLARGNGHSGVRVSANGTLIGGPLKNLGNVIVFNGTAAGAPFFSTSGVVIASNDNIVSFNKIGLGNNGQANQGNAGDGIHFIPTDVPQGTIMRENAIDHNGGAAVNDQHKKNKILEQKKMSMNGGLGIDIGLAGVTTDGMPVLTSAVVSGATVTVSGSRPSRTALTRPSSSISTATANPIRPDTVRASSSSAPSPSPPTPAAPSISPPPSMAATTASSSPRRPPT